MPYGSPLISIFFVFAAALVSASILARLRQPNLIGYLIAGMLIGPHGLKLVPYENVELLAEIGIGLLMFTIGVELSIAQLLRVKYIAVLGGCLILAITTVICLLLAPLFHWSGAEAAVWGLTTGLSSTVVVLKLLAERGEVGSAQGNISTGLLLFQDVISIPILVFLPILASGAGTSGLAQMKELGLILARLGGFLLVIYIVGGFIVPRLLRFIAQTKSKELFSLAVLSFTLGIAAITHQVGLSLALGAFLAGLVLSESDFSNQAASEILPLKDSFSAVFFVSVGMLLNFSYLVNRWPLFTLGLALIMTAKFFVILIVCFIFRYPSKVTVFVAIALSQIGEFGFLILVEAKKLAILSEGSYQRLLGISILSIIATPYLLKLCPRIKKGFAFMNRIEWIAREVRRTEPRVGEEESEGHGFGLENHVILCGYGPTGAIVAKKLHGVGIPVAVVDLNYRMIQSLKSQKQPAVYGDSSSSIVLEAAGLEKAALLIVTIPDPLAMQSLVKKVKRLKPELPIVCRVKYMSDRDRLLALGADDIVWEEFESGQELARRALDRLGGSLKEDVTTE
jgi:CPA2 family monovalent cation:H+ antiporter-2